MKSSATHLIVFFAAHGALACGGTRRDLLTSPSTGAQLTAVSLNIDDSKVPAADRAKLTAYVLALAPSGCDAKPFSMNGAYSGAATKIDASLRRDCDYAVTIELGTGNAEYKLPEGSVIFRGTKSVTKDNLVGQTKLGVAIKLQRVDGSDGGLGTGSAATGSGSAGGAVDLEVGVSFPDEITAGPGIGSGSDAGSGVEPAGERAQLTTDNDSGITYLNYADGGKRCDVVTAYDLKIVEGEAVAKALPGKNSKALADFAARVFGAGVICAKHGVSELTFVKVLDDGTEQTLTTRSKNELSVPIGMATTATIVEIKLRATYLIGGKTYVKETSVPTGNAAGGAI